jgi:hypothetical protein
MKSLKLSLIALSILLCLKIVYSQTSFTCTDTTPNQAADCNGKLTNSNNLCCYIETVQGEKNKKCISVPKSSYSGSSVYVEDELTYSIDCGSNAPKQGIILKSCGPSNAISKKDCSTGSSFVDSCCYYSGTGATITPKPNQGCYWLGTKYDGETTWGGMPLECNSNYLTYSFGLLFILILLL